MKTNKKPKRLDRSPMQVPFWLKRINPKTNKLYTEEEAIYHIKTFRKANLEYWLSRGYSYDEAVQKRYEYQRDSWAPGQITLKNHPELSTTHIEYWLKNGYSLEEAKKKLSERQTTFSLKKCIKRYGKEKGTKIFNARQKKWQKTLKKKPKSEINRINAAKYLFAKFIGKNVVRDENFFKELKQTCDKRRVVFIDNEKDLKTHIIHLFENTAYIENKGIKYFLDVVCPKYLYLVLGITRKTVISWLKELNIENLVPYKITTGKIPAYHMVTATNDILLSKLEIVFYNKIKRKRLKIDAINKCYPNSTLKFDFKIDGKYIEIAGLIGDDVYRSKMLYKRQTFGSFILTNKKDYDDFITRVLIQNDKHAIEYYLTRSI